jgi:inorganic pyrophosphatase
MSAFVVDAFIEIPTGSQNKYEFDKETGLAEDGDPLDILVMTSFPTFPGCVIESRVIGVLVMTDDKGKDEKLLAVPTEDPRFKEVQSLEDVAPHVLKEISHFFQVYKDLENKKVSIDGWQGADVAARLLEEAKARYSK